MRWSQTMSSPVCISPTLFRALCHRMISPFATLRLLASSLRFALHSQNGSHQAGLVQLVGSSQQVVPSSQIPPLASVFRFLYGQGHSCLRETTSCIMLTDVVYRYTGLVAAGCMILLGYDSSVFNSVQASENWKSAMDNPDPYMVGLVNTVYTVGGIVTGWFFAGPTVCCRANGSVGTLTDLHGILPIISLTTLAVDLAWASVA